MISPYTFQPRGRLLNVMRQVGDPGLINLAAGLPSVHCVPKEDLAKAFAVTLKENADESLGYHVPDGDVRLRELLVDRFRRRGVNTKVDQIVITTGDRYRASELPSAKKSRFVPVLPSIPRRNKKLPPCG